MKQLPRATEGGCLGESPTGSPCPAAPGRIYSRRCSLCPAASQVSPASTLKNFLHHIPPLSRQSREGSCDTGTGQSNVRCLLQGKEQHAQRRNARKGQGSSGFLCLFHEQRSTTMPGWVRASLRDRHPGCPPGSPGESEAASSQHWGKKD